MFVILRGLNDRAAFEIYCIVLTLIPQILHQWIQRSVSVISIILQSSHWIEICLGLGHLGTHILALSEDLGEVGATEGGALVDTALD